MDKATKSELKKGVGREDWFNSLYKKQEQLEPRKSLVNADVRWSCQAKSVFWGSGLETVKNRQEPKFLGMKAS